jgi:hypothetical protein
VKDELDEAAIAEGNRTTFSAHGILAKRSQTLIRMVIEDNSHNSGTIQAWIEKWHPVAAGALQAFAPLFEGKLEGAQMPPLEGVTQKLDKFYRRYLSDMGLQPSSSATLLF